MVVYLDNSSTTRQYEEVTEIMTRYMREDYGNPSSLHRMGLTAEKALKLARKQTAKYIGAEEDEIIFTGGGTGADNLAIFGAANGRKKRGNRIITTSIEHPAVLEPCKKLETMGFEVVYLPVSKEGVVDMEALKANVDEKTILISVMAVNNEVGTVQPLNEICKIRDDANAEFSKDILFHSDAVQAKPDSLEFASLRPQLPRGLDLISVSGHKLHGPKGIGALYIRKGLCIEPVIYGGGQEFNLQPGTENVPAIAGFGEALSIRNRKIQEDRQNVSFAEKKEAGQNGDFEENENCPGVDFIKSYLFEGLKEEVKDILLNGESFTKGESFSKSSPYILNVSFLGTRSEVILHTLEQDGIFVSTGSACASNKRGGSHVLKAMGKSPKEIEGAIRFSFHEFHTVGEMDYVISKVKEAVKKFRKLGSFR